LAKRDCIGVEEEMRGEERGKEEMTVTTVN